MRSAVAAILLALQALAMVSLSGCLGWEMSAHARMACCHREHPKAATSQSAADDCCAKHEQTRQPASSTLVTAAPTPATMPTAYLNAVFAAHVALWRRTLLTRENASLPLRASPGAFTPPLRV